MNEKNYITCCLIYSILFITSLLTLSLLPATFITFVFIIIQIRNLPFIRKLFKMTPRLKYGKFAITIEIIALLTNILSSCTFIYFLSDPWVGGNPSLAIALVALLAPSAIGAFLLVILSTLYLIVDFLKKSPPSTE
jgi:hypothetical protein